MTEATERLALALADRYRIERELGAGGMATVYLAQDLKHDRKVALKVLRPELAAVLGAERFVVEIKTTASLQHPHILPLFDSGSAGGFLYYVMPYIEGETLRDKLNRETQLGIDEAVRITTEVADALDYAHRNGVIHRDIKPENILLHDGRPMVADFGIALAVSAAAGGRMTETGLSLGTPHYMSPEQASAERDLTSRSDIYSLGSVLYEMLTGEPPHLGNSAQAIILKIVTEDAAPVTKLRKSVPPHVAAAVAKALERLPADRFETANAFAEALTDPKMAHLGVTRAAATSRTGAPNWPFRGAAAVAVAAMAVALWSLLRPGPPQLVSRFTIAFPAGQGPRDRSGNTIALSPDGRRFVYVGPGESGTQLWLREMDRLEATAIPGTESAASPFFSPDGRSVAFFTGGTLKVVSLDGGPPVTLATDTLYSVGGSWGDDGFLYVVEAGPELDPVVRIPAAGGAPDTVARPDTSLGREFAWPEVLPGGAGVLFTTHLPSGTNEDAAIAVASIATGKVTTILTGITARYAQPGFIVYARADGTLLAVPFDVGSLEVTGPSTALLGGISTKRPQTAEFSIARNGSLLYLNGEAGSEQMVWVDRDGGEQVIDPGLEQTFTAVALSPDGGRIALSYEEESGQNVWIYDLAQATLSRLTFQGSFNWRPEWLPGGREITYASRVQLSRDLYTIPADGSGSARLTAESDIGVQEASWSRDGRYLVYRTGPGRDAYTRNIMYLERGDTTPRTFLATDADEVNPKISPDGRWLAYVSDESGRDEVYVRPFPGPGGRWQISTDGGTEPLWSHAGREIFYRSRDGKLVSAAVTIGATFSVGQRRVLFSTAEYKTDRDHTLYDITPDDQRFLMIKQTGGSRSVVVVLNWFAEVMKTMGQ